MNGEKDINQTYNQTYIKKDITEISNEKDVIESRVPNTDNVEQNPYTKKISKLNNYLINENNLFNGNKYNARYYKTAAPYILFNLLTTELEEKYFDFDIGQQGGTLYKDVTINDETTAKQISEYEFDFDMNTKFDKNNVLILGGGPIGLAMAILLKLYIPELQVKIIEKRSKDDKRKLEREQLLLLNNFIQLYGYNIFLDTINKSQKTDDMKKNITSLYDKLRIDKIVRFNINSDNTTFYAFPNEYIRGKEGKDSDVEAISINMIEFFLSKKATELGILIVNLDINTIDDLKTHTTDKTLAIFDATGGRLQFNMPDWTDTNPRMRYYNCIMGNIDLFKDKNKPNQQSENEYFLKNKTDFYLCLSTGEGQKIDAGNYVTDTSKIKETAFEFKVKGYNKNHTRLIDGIPLICIGDSIRSTDFTSGTGIQFGLMHNLLCALIFKKYYDFISGNVGIPQTTEKEIIISNGDKALSENVLLILKYFGIPNPHFPLLKPEIVSTGGKNKKRKTKKNKKRKTKKTKKSNE